jgi:minor extracellular protease Epr
MKKSKKSTSIIIAITLALSMSVSTLTTQKVNAQESTDNSPRQVIVVLKDKSSTKSKSSELKSKGKTVKELDNVHSITTSLTDSEINDLKKDPNVRSVEEDTKLFAIQDTETTDWGITDVGAQNSWSSDYTGADIKIAVIDTGVDTDHPDFAATTGAAAAISGGVSEVDYTTSFEDDNGHGTHVAGIIGARQNGTGIVGIAPESSIYAVKALGKDGSGYTSDIIAGIDWAIGQGVDIISMSLGSSTGSTALQNACDTANNDGILVVAAAGNNGSKTTTVKSKDTITYPAKYASVIAVGAVDSSNNRAYFSSTGSELDVVAPGVNILSDKYTGGTIKMSGTSMATPFVAGDLALLKQANPNYTSTQLRALLESTCKDLSPTGTDSLYGHGLIQAPVK